MYLIVGLGNPGKQYENTRHNIGFVVIKEIAKRCDAELRSSRTLESFFARADIEGTEAVLLLPQTYMNNSGRAVAAAKKKFGLKPENIIVIHDEIDLPPASIKIKNGGGAAGHNGLRSMIEHLGDKDFIRVRIGVGKPEKSEISGAEYVLSAFNKSEKKYFNSVVRKAADAVESIVLYGVEKAMNTFNKKIQ